jgi:hypothetical protein
MTTSKEMVLIGGVARALRERGSWTGETHIQKASYILKIRRSIPFESEFVLYKHGPFSFDMNKSIVHMLSRGMLFAESNRGYGPSILVNNSLWNALDARLGNFFGNFQSDVYAICGLLARKNVAELERIATAVYVSVSFPLLSWEDRAITISRLKPHIDRDAAMAALREAEVIQ